LKEKTKSWTSSDKEKWRTEQTRAPIPKENKILREQTFSTISDTRAKAPSLPWQRIKEKVLGKKYSLTLILVGNSLSKRLNSTYRHKEKPTNVLAFPYSKTSGEIFLNLIKAKAEAPTFGHTFRKHCAFLFIHALHHLKGMRHGSKMESEERKAIKTLGL
jgi:probable rRNA maturation factor